MRVYSKYTTLYTFVMSPPTLCSLAFALAHSLPLFVALLLAPSPHPRQLHTLHLMAVRRVLTIYRTAFFVVGVVGVVVVIVSVVAVVAIVVDDDNDNCVVFVFFSFFAISHTL